MAMTRDVLVRLTEELLDGVNSARYPTLLKLQALNTAHDMGWRRILSANRHYRWATVDATTDSDGRIAVSSLSTGSGDDQQRFHKLLDAVQGTTHYRPVNDQRDTLYATVSPTRAAYEVFRVGDQLQLTPVQSGAVITCAVSHLPTAPASLSAGTVNVVWPDGFEFILAYETASLLFPKGGQDIGGSLHMKDQADMLWESLIADVQRFSTEPLVIGASDDAGEWGST